MITYFTIEDDPKKRTSSKTKDMLTHGRWENPLIKGASYTAGVCFTLFIARLLLYLFLSGFDRCSKFVEFMSSFNLLGS